MAAENMTNKKKPELIDIEKKDGLLEELDLPPKVIKAIRENATLLQIAGVAIALILFGWTFYKHHTATKLSNASTALHLAVTESEEGNQVEMLKKVADDYSGTDAAFWSKIEQGHLAFKKGDYSEALTKYKGVENDIADNSPLAPVLYNSIGLASENSGDLDTAAAYFAKLEKIKGFKLTALLARGRVLELQGKTEEALKIYQEAALEKDLTGSGKSILTEKINNLQSSGSGE